MMMMMMMIDDDDDRQGHESDTRTRVLRNCTVSEPTLSSTSQRITAGR
jgi:hypothetical protein